MVNNLLSQDSLNSEESMDAKLVICVEPECANEFEIASGEVQFYIDRRLDLPKRCKPCRDSRNQQFSKAITPDTRLNYSPHEVVCENCNKSATVPFLPVPGKAVYCKICWEGIKNLPLSAQRQ